MMKHCKLTLILVFLQIFIAGENWAANWQGNDIAGKNTQNAAQIIEKAYAYVRHPDLLTMGRVKHDFPGKYKPSGCEERFKFCSYVNEDDAEPARLSSFEVEYRPLSTPAGGILTLTLPGSGDCYRLSDLDVLFGTPGRRPEMPVGDMFFGPEEPETVLLQYKKINRQYPELSAAAFVRKQCVVTLNLDLRVKP
jgi:hypothetical protein